MTFIEVVRRVKYIKEKGIYVANGMRWLRIKQFFYGKKWYGKRYTEAHNWKYRCSVELWNCYVNEHAVFFECSLLVCIYDIGI